MPPLLLVVSWRLVLLASSALDLTSAFSPPPSWDQLQAMPGLNKPPRPIFQDALPDDLEARGQRQPILYRDKECICAASQTVWLAMECKNVEYLTVLVSKEVDDAVPRIVWPDDENDNESAAASESKSETDPIKLLEQIQSRYPDLPPHLYPRVSAAVDGSRCGILRLPGIMPRYSAPEFDSLAPFLFKEDGTKVLASSHKVTLEEIEEMQEEYFLGSYLCGRDVCAADMVWAPYLERYAVQLPLLFPNDGACHPRTKRYEEVMAWYATMEALPAYACCVMGDARHWRRCLERVVPMHDERAVDEEEKVHGLPPPPEKFGWWTKSPNPREDKIWKEYAASRPWSGDDPAGEAALCLTRNREYIVATAAADLAPERADEALREVVLRLLRSSSDDDAVELSEEGRRMARLASERMEVPRDVAAIPAMALVELIRSTQ